MKFIAVLLSICLFYTTTFAKTFVYKHNDFKISTIYELKKQYPNAEFISDRLLSIPIHFSLSEQDINTIREVIYDCISTPASI